MEGKNNFLYWSNNLNEVEDVILMCFFPETEEMVITQIIKRSGYSYEKVNTALKQLEKKGIISSKKVGRALVYVPHCRNLYLRHGFYHYMTERLINFASKYPVLYKSLKNVSEGIFGIVLLFGSYSKGNETKNSDIDLMIVSDSEKDSLEKINEIKLRYSFNISPVFIKKTEFPKIKKDNPEMWQDIKESAIIFNGKDIYYYLMYENE